MGLLDAVVLAASGEPVGRVVEVMVDPVSHDPRWLRVALDHPGADVAGAAPDVVVPAVAVSETEPGVLTAAYDAPTIRSARHDGATLSAVEATRLAALYGLPDGDGRSA